MAFLSGWDSSKRYKITVDNTNIDSDLTHFAVPLTISTSAGISNADVSAIFDELGTNSLKIAITKTDGTTEIYGEIEKWDSTGEEAIIWVSKSDLVLSSSATTDLYLYYDSTHANNTTYIATQGSRTEVWDSCFKGVWHLSESSGTAIDSTSNNNDLTDNNTVTSATGQIDGARDFESDNSEYLSITDASQTGLGFTGDFTFQAIVKPERVPNSSYINLQIFTKFGSSYVFKYYADPDDSYTPKFRLSIYESASAEDLKSAAKTLSTTQFTNIVLTFDASASTVKFYIDGVQLGTDVVGTHTSIDDTASNFSIGALNGTQLFDGIIDESRACNTVLSAAFIKADYNASIDNLVTWTYDPATGDTSGFFRFF